MMRYLILILSFLPFNNILLAQSDTSAYTAQRNIVNRLLEERSAKFGQYDNSLTKRSGIFGLKTKRDIQASNDILTRIVLNDNEIFSELKILLDYKDFEKKEVESRAETVEGRIERFQSTITRLQQENDKLRAENEKQVNKGNKLLVYMAFTALALILSVFYTFRLKKLRKTDI